ncbi:hypothetical protein L218DRAFT_966841 [Marasmius fiardii PR-910]|nr:hypothetical protein L218DRAFT_966841 [Marasmius fiardii PR-910]
MLNSNTLTVLDLGLWGIGSVLNGFSAERYTLPVLEELKLTINFYRDFVVFVQKIDLPSLKRLSILDDYNLYLNWSPLHRPTISNRNFPTDCLEGYTAMMDFWPLEQVTELALKFIILHEMEGNRISRLRPSHKEQELWEGGYPLATRFFYRFSSVRSLVLQGVDATTSDAIWVPPRRYNPALGTFDDVVPLFPSCPRPPGYVD